MIKKAEGQEIDLILTKSISCFSLNNITLSDVYSDLKALKVSFGTYIKKAEQMLLLKINL